MANLTAKCGTVLLIELTMNCSNSKISVSAVERSDFVKVAFSLRGPRCRTLKVRVGQATFFCCSARCSHQSYFVSKSTSSKIGSYFLRRLTLSHDDQKRNLKTIFPPTTPMPSYSHRLDTLIAGASSQKAGPILRKVEKTSATPAGYRCLSSFWCK
jgi:hypothetical protein